MEERGNARVVLRIRGFPHGACVEHPHMQMTAEGGITMRTTRFQSYFRFYNLLGQRASQEDVAWEVLPFVRGVFRQYDSLILAYGQTSAGKTHTMFGDLASRTDEGLVPRVFREIFQTIGRTADMSCQLGISMLHVYRGQVEDLYQKRRVLTDREIMDPTTWAMEKIESEQDVIPLIEAGSANRVTKATMLNAVSSRGHLIVVVTLQGRLEVGTEEQRVRSQFCNRLYLADLAGSEKLKLSLAEGTMREETLAVNMSLTTLGSAFEARVRKDPLPALGYRSNKLTFLLESVLKAGKILMLAHVDPRELNAAESKNTLVFANRCQGGRMETESAGVDHIGRRESISKAQLSVALIRAKEEAEWAGGDILGQASKVREATLAANAGEVLRRRESVGRVQAARNRQPHELEPKWVESGVSQTASGLALGHNMPAGAAPNAPNAAAGRASSGGASLWQDGFQMEPLPPNAPFDVAHLPMDRAEADGERIRVLQAYTRQLGQHMDMEDAMNPATKQLLAQRNSWVLGGGDDEIDDEEGAAAEEMPFMGDLLAENNGEIMLHGQASPPTPKRTMTAPQQRRSVARSSIEKEAQGTAKKVAAAGDSTIALDHYGMRHFFVGSTFVEPSIPPVASFNLPLSPGNETDGGDAAAAAAAAAAAVSAAAVRKGTSRRVGARDTQSAGGLLDSVAQHNENVVTTGGIVHGGSFTAIQGSVPGEARRQVSPPPPNSPQPSPSNMASSTTRRQGRSQSPVGRWQGPATDNEPPATRPLVDTFLASASNQDMKSPSPEWAPAPPTSPKSPSLALKSRAGRLRTGLTRSRRVMGSTARRQGAMQGGARRSRKMQTKGKAPPAITTLADYEATSLHVQSGTVNLCDDRSAAVKQARVRPKSPRAPFAFVRNDDELPQGGSEVYRRRKPTFARKGRGFSTTTKGKRGKKRAGHKNNTRDSSGETSDPKSEGSDPRASPVRPWTGEEQRPLARDLASAVVRTSFSMAHERIDDKSGSRTRLGEISIAEMGPDRYGATEANTMISESDLASRWSTGGGAVRTDLIGDDRPWSTHGSEASNEDIQHLVGSDETRAVENGGDGDQERNALTLSVTVPQQQYDVEGGAVATSMGLQLYDGAAATSMDLQYSSAALLMMQSRAMAITAELYGGEGCPDKSAQGGRVTPARLFYGGGLPLHSPTAHRPVASKHKGRAFGGARGHESRPLRIRLTPSTAAAVAAAASAKRRSNESRVEIDSRVPGDPPIAAMSPCNSPENHASLSDLLPEDAYQIRGHPDNEPRGYGGGGRSRRSPPPMPSRTKKAKGALAADRGLEERIIRVPSIVVSEASLIIGPSEASLNNDETDSTCVNDDLVPQSLPYTAAVARIASAHLVDTPEQKSVNPLVFSSMDPTFGRSAKEWDNSRRSRPATAPHTTPRGIPRGGGDDVGRAGGGGDGHGSRRHGAAAADMRRRNQGSTKRTGLTSARELRRGIAKTTTSSNGTDNPLHAPSRPKTSQAMVSSVQHDLGGGSDMDRCVGGSGGGGGEEAEEEERDERRRRSPQWCAFTGPNKRGLWKGQEDSPSFSVQGTLQLGATIDHDGSRDVPPSVPYFSEAYRAEALPTRPRTKPQDPPPGEQQGGRAGWSRRWQRNTWAYEVGEKDGHSDFGLHGTRATIKNTSGVGVTASGGLARMDSIHLGSGAYGPVEAAAAAAAAVARARAWQNDRAPAPGFMHVGMFNGSLRF